MENSREGRTIPLRVFIILRSLEMLFAHDHAGCIFRFLDARVLLERREQIISRCVFILCFFRYLALLNLMMILWLKFCLFKFTFAACANSLYLHLVFPTWKVHRSEWGGKFCSHRNDHDVNTKCHGWRIFNEDKATGNLPSIRVRYSHVIIVKPDLLSSNLVCTLIFFSVSSGCVCAAL